MAGSRKMKDNELGINPKPIARRLRLNALGKLTPPMTPAEVRSAEVLLDRLVAKRQAVEHSGEMKSTVLRAPTPSKTSQEWLDNYAPQAPTEAEKTSDIKSDQVH